MLFCRLTRGICRFCVYVIINKRSFESFMCLDPVIYHQNLQNDEKGNYKPKIVETTGEIAESICDEQTKGNTGHLICICVL